MGGFTRKLKRLGGLGVFVGAMAHCAPFPETNPTPQLRGLAPQRETNQAAQELSAHDRELLSKQPERNIAEALPPEQPSAPHGYVYSTKYITWIYQARDPSAPQSRLNKVGYIRAGHGVALREPERIPARAECRSGYYAVEPRGQVCADHTTTTDAAHPVVRATQELVRLSEEQSPIYPYNYGFSIGAPMYNYLPSEEQHRLAMLRYREKPWKLGDWAKGFEDLASTAQIPGGIEAPSTFSQGNNPAATDGLVRKSLPHGSMVAYGKSFEANGRVWLITPELSLVPADRVRPYRRTLFKGVQLSSELRLPLAWPRVENYTQYQLAGGELRPVAPKQATPEEHAAQEIPTKQAISLTGNERRASGKHYAETKSGLWIETKQFRIAKIKAPTADLNGEATWIHLSLSQNTLVAYRGERAVYATLHSPGRGGTHRGKGSVRNYTTPLGSFPINWKERWGTMSPDGGAPTSFWISDVMWTQYFKQPYAIHGAYWHERFGEPQSAGCPNLSPEDAHWLFQFTEPRLPEGWHGIAPTQGEPTTWIVLTP